MQEPNTSQYQLFKVTNRNQLSPLDQQLGKIGDIHIMFYRINLCITGCSPRKMYPSFFNTVHKSSLLKCILIPNGFCISQLLDVLHGQNIQPLALQLEFPVNILLMNNERRGFAVSLCLTQDRYFMVVLMKEFFGKTQN